MNATKEQLRIFGLGLGILIPFINWMHMMKPTIGFGVFVILFVLILVVIAQSQKRPWIYYPVLGGLLYAISRLQGGHPVSNVSIFFLAAALMIWILTMINVELIRPLYTVWMKIATGISHAVTFLLMVIMFYGVFAVVGIILRILRKDFLDRALEPEKRSYWHERPQISYDRERSKKQY
jgi:hypothetical protein